MPRQIVVEAVDGSDHLPGMIACAIRREWEPDAIYLVSCRHVLGFPAIDALTGEPSRVRLADGPPGIIAEAHPSLLGFLLDDAALPPGTRSCDVQLARAVDPVACRQALGDVDFIGLLSPTDPIPDLLFILTSRGPLPVTGGRLITGGAENRRDYVTASATNVCLDPLLETTFSAAGTRRGDSGSPVATKPQGGLLVGMHIGRGEGRCGPHSYAIPAWDLLSPGRYNAAAAEHGTWRLLRPREIEGPVAPSLVAGKAGGDPTAA